MIKYLVSTKYLKFWIVFHILLGLAATVSPWILIGWYYLVFVFSLPLLLDRAKYNSSLSYLIVYLVSFEVFSRMVRTTPFISYEQSKYLTLFLTSFGLLQGANRLGREGLLMVLLLIPALFYDFSGLVTFPFIVFDVLGPINLGLCIWFFSNQRFTPSGFLVLIRLMVFPIISALFFTFIKTPDFDSIEFELGANFETTGGFGSNQVSVLFGLGIFLMFIFIIFKWRFSGNFWIDSFFLLGFAFQGLLSFSRGGIIGGAIGILGLLYVLKRNSGKIKDLANIPKVGRYLVPAILTLMVTFVVVNNLTGGLLMLRYSGETEGTMAGAKERSIDTFTSYRAGIAMEDLGLFIENPILGTGAASSRYLREEHFGTAPHIEVSRLFAEHGIFGIGYMIVFATVFFSILRRKDNIKVKSVLIAFALVAIYTTFHAATRTFITPLVFGLAMISVRSLNKRPGANPDGEKDNIALIKPRR